VKLSLNSYYYVFFLCLACTKTRDEPEPTTATLSGTVSLIGDTLKLKDVNVSLEDGIGDITDEQGYFLIENVAIGTQTVVFSHTNYQQDTLELSIDKEGVDFSHALYPIESLLSIHSEQLEEESLRFNFGKEIDVFEFEIQNLGEKELSWEITTDKKWLTTNLVTGVNEAVVLVTVDRDSLFVPSETASLIIKDQDGISQKQLMFTLEKDIPTIVLSSSDFVSYDKLDFGKEGFEIDLTISKEGEGELHWEFIEKPYFLSLSQTEGFGDTQMKLYLDTSTLSYDWRIHQGLLKLRNKENLDVTYVEVYVDNSVSLEMVPTDGSYDYGYLMRGKFFDLIINHRFPIDWEVGDIAIKHSVLSDWLQIYQQPSGVGDQKIEILVDRFNSLGQGFPDYHAFDYDTAEVFINYLGGERQMSFEVTVEKRVKRLSESLMLYNDIKQPDFGYIEAGVMYGTEVRLFLHNYIEGVLRLDFNTSSGILTQGTYFFSNTGNVGTVSENSLWSYTDNLHNSLKFVSGSAHVDRLEQDHWFTIEFAFDLENGETIEGSFTAYFPELD